MNLQMTLADCCVSLLELMASTRWVSVTLLAAETLPRNSVNSGMNRGSSALVAEIGPLMSRMSCG